MHGYSDFIAIWDKARNKKEKQNKKRLTPCSKTRKLNSTSNIWVQYLCQRRIILSFFPHGSSTGVVLSFRRFTNAITIYLTHWTGEPCSRLQPTFRVWTSERRIIVSMTKIKTTQTSNYNSSLYYFLTCRGFLWKNESTKLPSLKYSIAS